MSRVKHGPESSQPTELIAPVLLSLPTNWRVLALTEYGRAAQSANGLCVIETLTAPNGVVLPDFGQQGGI